MSGGRAGSPHPQGTHVHVDREHDVNNPYVQFSPVPQAGTQHPPPTCTAQSGWTNNGSKDNDVINKGGKKFDEVIADNVWNHRRWLAELLPWTSEIQFRPRTIFSRLIRYLEETNPSIIDAAMARVTQGTRVLTEGGWGKGQPLYLSTKSLAFCSDNPLCYYLPNGQQQWMYYKLVVPLDHLGGVNPSTNRLDHSVKYIQILTREGHEYWFMGFISSEKALKNINEALQQYRNQ